MHYLSSILNQMFKLDRLLKFIHFANNFLLTFRSRAPVVSLSVYLTGLGKLNGENEASDPNQCMQFKLLRYYRFKSKTVNLSTFLINLPSRSVDTE